MSKDKEEVYYYAQKKIPALVIWYLPVVDRLRSLFANPEDAKLMSWHASDGICSSIRSFVSMKDLALTNYNSHDYHVMLSTFLPIAIRAINPAAVTRLCYFFNKITQKVIHRDELESLQEFVVETVS